MCSALPALLTVQHAVSRTRLHHSILKAWQMAELLTFSGQVLTEQSVQLFVAKADCIMAVPSSRSFDDGAANAD